MKITVLLLLITTSFSINKEHNQHLLQESYSYRHIQKGEKNNESKLSPSTKLFLERIQEEGVSKTIKQDYKLTKTREGYFVRAILKVEAEVDEQTLKEMGVLIGSKERNSWTTILPIDSIENLAMYNGIKYIQIYKQPYLKK